MANISVLGSGSWGTAMAVFLAESGHKVKVWTRNAQTAITLSKTRENARYLPGIKIPENVSFTDKISECADAETVIVATPSHTVREVAKKFAPYAKDSQIIVSISKGFDEEKKQRLSCVINEEIPNAVVVAMSGPSHAEEVALALPTTNVVAHPDIKVAQHIQSLFMSPAFRLYASDDIIGVELGGSLKNIIALCAGISDGLGYGDNAKAAIITRGIAEITRLGIAMGAKKDTFSGLSGIGDLIVTCTSMHSRNRRAGILIGKGKTPEEAREEVGMVVEGIKAAKAAHALSKKYNVEMPIANEAYKVLFENLPASACVKNLMERSMKNETEKTYNY